MAKKLKSVLGIDIGSHSIKVCEVKATGNGATVSAVGVTPTPEGAVDYSGIYNTEAVGLALKQVLTEAGAGTSDVVVSISGTQSVLVRVLTVPKMNTEKELADHMEWEIGKNIPFAETTIMSDYKVLPNQDPNAPEQDVVMAMAPQSAIDAVIDCIKRAGRKPFAIDVEPLGLARSLSLSYPEYANEPGVCIVDIGHSTTSINVYQNGSLALPRPVPGGGEMLTRTIADSQGIGFAEAEEYKVSRFAIPSDAVAMDQSFDPYGGGMTTSFDSSYSAGGYVPAGPGGYDPNQTSAIDPFAVTPPADADAAGDELAIDPVTGLPVESTPVVDPFAAPADADAPVYSNDPFGTPGAPPVSDPFSVSDSAPVVSQSANDPVFESVRMILEELVQEIRRSTDYFAGKGGSVSRVVLLGGGSKLAGLAGYIERSLSISTEVYDPLKNLGVATKKASAEYVNEYKQQIAVAVGNGLHILD